MRSLIIASIILSAGNGCACLNKLQQGGGVTSCDQPKIHVNAPPQKIVIEKVSEGGCENACVPASGGRECSTAQSEGATAQAAPLPQPNAVPQGAMAGFNGPSAVSMGMGLPQTTAVTSPLSTAINPGGGGLGFGLGVIRIPIPVIRIFHVRENPSISVPLSQASIVAGNSALIQQGGVIPAAGMQAIGPYGLPIATPQMAVANPQLLAQQQAANAGPQAQAQAQQMMQLLQEIQSMQSNGRNSAPTANSADQTAPQATGASAASRADALEAKVNGLSESFEKTYKLLGTLESRLSQENATAKPPNSNPQTEGAKTTQ